MSGRQEERKGQAAQIASRLAVLASRLVRQAEWAGDDCKATLVAARDVGEVACEGKGERNREGGGVKERDEYELYGHFTRKVAAAAAQRTTYRWS